MKKFINSALGNFKIFKNGIDNWFHVALNMFILKKGVNCKIRNIGEVRLKEGKNYLNSSLFRALVFSNTKDLSPDQFDLLKNYLPQIDNDVIDLINYEDKHQFKFLNYEISTVFESFLYGDYDYVPYTDNESLIDIGGNIGDTAIYFANKGYQVYAFEPVPFIYEKGVENINLNPSLKDKITFVNKACSCKKGFSTINFNVNDPAGASEFKEASQSVKIENTTISDIINDYNIKPNILKIDCEGCEVNIVKHSDLSMFKEIILEYHTNITGVDENILIDILKNQGFELKNQVKFKQNGMGIIHMVK